MSEITKKYIPNILLSLLAGLMISEWFLPIQALTTLKMYLTTCTAIIANCAFGLGIFYAITAEIAMMRRERNRTQNIYTGALIGMMILTIFVGLYYGATGPTSIFDGVFSNEFKWYIDWVYRYMEQTGLGVMFLFMTGALYRVCRVRSMETFVLMFVSTVYILRSIPLFLLIPGLLELGDWMILVPSLAGTRAANLAAACGAMVIGLRVLLGKEKTLA